MVMLNIFFCRLGVSKSKIKSQRGTQAAFSRVPQQTNRRLGNHIWSERRRSGRDDPRQGQGSKDRREPPPAPARVISVSFFLFCSITAARHNIINDRSAKPRDDLENSSDRNQAIASSLATVLQKNFNVKSPQATSQIERCPTFVAKEKSIKPKFLSKNKKVKYRFILFIFVTHPISFPRLFLLCSN